MWPILTALHHDLTQGCWTRRLSSLVPVVLLLFLLALCGGYLLAMSTSKSNPTSDLTRNNNASTLNTLRLLRNKLNDSSTSEKMLTTRKSVSEPSNTPRTDGK